MEQIWGGFQVRARASLGVESFGLSVMQLPPSFEQMPPHTHDFDGQEEVYFAIKGSGALVFGDGSEVALDDDTLVRVGPRVNRKIVSGPDALQVLVVGGTPGQSYSVIPHSELGAAEPNPSELPGVSDALGGAGVGEPADDVDVVRLSQLEEHVYRGELNTFWAVGRALGTEAFGIAVIELKQATGENPYPRHNHAKDGQTEVYVVERGAGSITLGDESVELAAGEMVAVPPALDRQLAAGPEGMRVVAIGA